jgi:N-acetylglucosaminyldiphosphoundecaprenol N-acetyl-beta-D-mannosaminyltransferase
MEKNEIPLKIIKTDLLSLDELCERKGCIYTFLNPVSYLDALNNKDLFTQYDGIFADGSLLVAAIRLIYGKKVNRRSFDMTSLAPRLFEHVIKSGKSIYIVASKQEQVVRAVEIIKERYPDIRIEGYRNGYFANEEEMNREALQIAQVAPDFLIVGMGAVMQERFLLRTKKAGFKGIGFTCGGFIHQTASNQIDYYPAWVDRMNLRFIYRMLKEDYTRKRYFKAALLFPAKFICERIFE